MNAWFLDSELLTCCPTCWTVRGDSIKNILVNYILPKLPWPICVFTNVFLTKILNLPIHQSFTLPKFCAIQYLYCLTGCYYVLLVSLNDFYSSYLWPSEVILISVSIIQLATDILAELS